MTTTEQPRTLPPVFDRLVIILAVQAHLFAALLIVEERAVFRSLPGVMAIWALSLLTPLACLVAARRTGGVLTGRAFAAAAASLAVVDLSVLVLIPQRDLGNAGIWTWGAVGVSILTLAPFRPARDILSLGAGHALVTVAVMASAWNEPQVGAFRVWADLNAALLPALVATQFTGLYVQAVRTREAATVQESASRARTLATQAVADDAARRLGRLQAEAIPLLRQVATGELEASDTRVAVLAQRLSDELRRELLESQEGAWLLRPTPAGHTAGELAPDILDPQRCLDRLHDADRAALTALVTTLLDGQSWHRLSVALTEGAQPDIPGPTHDASITVVALGPSAPSAASHAQITAAAHRLAARVSAESSGVLVVDIRVPLRARLAS